MNIILIFSIILLSLNIYSNQTTGLHDARMVRQAHHERLNNLSAPPVRPELVEGYERVELQSNDNNKSLHIKVLLNDKTNNQNLLITSDNDLIITHINNDQIQKKISNKLEVTINNNAIYINGKKFNKDSFKIRPTLGNLKFNNREYQGYFIVLKDKNALHLINVLQLEDYVTIVLRTESWPGWPLEANKVLAIAARTYAVNKIMEAKNQNLPYHIKTTTEHQTFKGVLKNKYTDILKQAALETAGLIITYNKKPILAMHDSCCAGIIPGNVEHINFDKAPYLKRHKECHHCKISKFYKWESVLSKNDMEELLKQEIPNLKNLNSITITKTDREGIPQQLEIKDSKTKYYISGKTFYFLNKKIRSYFYTIKKLANKFVISGRGVGHHLGLCQWGARELVGKGWHYKDILQFYYPGTSLMKLKVK